MTMLLEISILLVTLKLAEAGNCTYNCIECVNGTCLTCHEDYYGENCSICKQHCDDGWCGAFICPFGCEKGWYMLQCVVPCSEDCRGGCDQFNGDCDVPSSDVPSRDVPSKSCQEGVCTERCQQYCHNNHNNQGKNKLTLEHIMMIAAGFTCFILSCACCLVKSRTRARAVQTKTENTDIGPVDQRLLPGQLSGTFAPSHRTYNPTSFGTACFDPENVLMYPSNSQACSSDVTVHVTTAEMPPPAYVPNCEEETSPPSYESLFNPTVTHSSYSSCSK